MPDFDTAVPIDEALTPPSAWYTEEAVATSERTRVFGSEWIFVGRLDQVTQLGAYFSGVVAGEPYLVVGGEDWVGDV